MRAIQDATGKSGRLTIGVVARRARIRPSALRYYESIGLLPAPERISGQRRYELSVLQRLAVIDFAKQCGFTIAETQTLFEGIEPSSSLTTGAKRWKALARRKLTELDATIARARAMQQLLELGLECDCLELEECSLIAAQKGQGHEDNDAGAESSQAET